MSRTSISCRILSVVLTLAMACAMVPAASFTAFAADEPETATQAVVPQVQQAQPDEDSAALASQTPTGTGLSGSLGDMSLNSGSYYLSDDATGNLTVQDGQTVTLDLNGHILESAANDKPVVTVGTIDASSAALTLIDSDAEATHSGSYASLPAGGVITGAVNSANSGGGVRNLGTFTMSGGTIYGNKTENITCTGAGVYNQGTFTMSGGCISNNTSSAGNGAGVANQGATLGGSFIMTGGKITNNTVGVDGTASGSGGGVYNESALEITGGEISGNIAHAMGGGVDYSTGSMTVGGTAVIKNNASGKDVGSQKADNLYISKDKYVSVATGEKAPVADKMEIGVTLYSGTGQVTSANAKDYHGHFSSDNMLYGTYNKVDESNNYVYIGNAAIIIEKGTIYGSVNEAISAAENQWQLSSATIQMLMDSKENLDLSSPALSSCTDIALDLNGHVLESAKNGTSIISVGDGITVAIKDSKPEATHSDSTLPKGGVITGGNAGNGGGIYVKTGATLTMAGGTICGNTATSNGGGICVETSATLTMAGGTICGNTATSNGGGICFGMSAGCFTAGTQIAMADGSTRAIEDIAEGDIVKTFDHESGKASSAKVYFAYKGEMQDVPFTLTFDNGKTLSIVDCHDLLEQTDRKYVTITAENAGNYIGRSFYGEDGQWHELLDVARGSEASSYYSIYTAGHLNCFANGFLTVADDVDYLLNIYELDENLTANAAQLEADVAEYGLLPFEYACEKTGMTREQYESSNSKYLYITYGKGLWTEEEAVSLYDKTNDSVSGANAGTKQESAALTALDSTLSSVKSLFIPEAYAEEPSEAISGLSAAGVLTIGSNAKIAGNTTSSGNGGGVYLVEGMLMLGDTTKVEGNKKGTGDSATTNNLYLPSDKTVAISATSPLRSGANIGVTLENKTGQFTSNGTKADEAYFFSDNVAYADKYNTGGYLELVTGYAVTCASCTNGTVSVGNQTSAYQGETVTVMATPEEGYELEEVKITKTDGGTDVTTAVGYDSAQSTFTMPDYAVTVSATFKEKPAHTHSWTYETSKSSTGLIFDDTITAECTGSGTCDYTGTDKSLTIQAPENLTYDGSTHDASFGNAKTFLGSDLPAITYVYKATSGGEYASTTDTTAAGYYKASATVGEGAAAKIISVEYTVSKAQLTLTGTQVLNKSYDGNTIISCGVGAVQGAVKGEDVKVDVESSTVADKNVGVNKPVTIVFKVTGDDAGNYIAPANNTSLTATISAAQLNVTGTSADGKTYDGNTTAIAHIGTLSGKVEGDDVNVAIASATFDNKNAGNGHDVTVTYKTTGSDAGNYVVPTDSKTSADIKKKSIKAAAENKTSYVGSELVALSYTSDKLAEGDSWAGELATTANKDAIGTYDITQGNLAVSDGNSGNNYSVSFTKGTYTVTAKIIQDLKFEGVSGGTLTKTFGDAAFTEAVSGATTSVSYESTDTSVATVDANGRVTILKAGTTTIKATAAETAEYAQGSAQYTLTVNKVKVAVPQAKSGLVYNGQVQTGVESPQGALYTLENNQATDADTYNTVASLNDKVNYAWDGASPEDADQNIPWSIAQKQVTVTADDKTMTLGDKVPEFTATVSGTLGIDTVSYEFDTIDPKTQGAYTITAKGDASQGNYIVAYAQGTLIVSAPQADKAANPEDLAKVLAKYRTDEQYAGKTLDVVLRTDGEIPQADKDKIAAKAGSGKKVAYNSADLVLVIVDASGTTEKNIGNENDTLVSVVYKFDFSNKTDIQTLRVHNDAASEITETANADGEYVKYDKDAGTITVAAKKYSTFAFAYNEGSEKQEDQSSAVASTGDNAGLLVLAGFAAAAIAAGCLVVSASRRREQ